MSAPSNVVNLIYIDRKDNSVWRFKTVADNSTKIVVENAFSGELRVASESEFRTVDQSNLTIDVPPESLADSWDASNVSPEAAEQAEKRARIIRSEMAGEISAKKAWLELEISRATYYELKKAYNPELGAISVLSKPRGRKEGSTSLSNAVEEIIARHIENLYRGEDASVGTIHTSVVAECEDSQLDPPSYKAVSARVKRWDSKKKMTQSFGKERANATLNSFPGRREMHRALEQVQIDHTTADVFLCGEKNRKPIGRPTITLVICSHTKVVHGFHISFAPPSQSSVAHAMYHAVSPKENFMKDLGLGDYWYDVWGTPESVLTDHGKEFKAGNFRRALALNNSRLEHRKKKQDGGIGERLGGTLNIGHVHILPGGTGSRPRKDRDFDPAKHAVMTYREFVKYFTRAVVIYHDTVGSDGKRPKERWIEYFTDADGSRRLPLPVRNPKQFALEILPEKNPVIQKTGVRINDFFYFHSSLKGQVGKKIRVKYDVVNMYSVFIYMDGVWTEAPTTGKPPRTLAQWKIIKSSLGKPGRPGVEAGKAILERNAELAKLFDRKPGFRKTSEAGRNSEAYHSLGVHTLPLVEVEKPRDFSQDVEAFPGDDEEDD